jgi:hypothetical protein
LSRLVDATLAPAFSARATTTPNTSSSALSQGAPGGSEAAVDPDLLTESLPPPPPLVQAALDRSGTHMDGGASVATKKGLLEVGVRSHSRYRRV